MEFEAGDAFAGHVVESACHEGSMSLLYRVRGPGGERRMLKLPRTGFGAHPACLTGFETERLLLQRLGGGVAPRVMADGDVDGLPWMIVEDVGEDSLAARLCAGALPADEAMRLGAAIAEALAALHRQGVVHHDLKPAHVRFRADGSVALIDFGLARQATLPDFVADEAAARGVILGTPAYVAPEQAAGQRGDPRSDVFSLGAILYRMVTGVLPFGEPRSRFAIGLRNVLDCRPPRELSPDCPAALQEIVLHCLEPDPEARYGSAGQVASDLRHPEQVVLGERAERRHRRAGAALHRLFAGVRAIASEAPPAPPTPGEGAPQILVALDIAHGEAALAVALRAAVRLLTGAVPQSRVICVYVLADAGGAALEDADGLVDGMRAEALMALHHWAAPLGLPAERLRFVVLESGDAAGALLDFVQRRQIDHLVVGARGHSTLRRLIGSVSAKLAAEAPCSVSVVREP